MSLLRRHILKDNHGASILIALVFALICAMIAAVVITAASVNANRTPQHVEEQQAYLDRSSAAQLIQSVFASEGVALNFRVASSWSTPTLTSNNLGSGIAGWIKTEATRVYSYKTAGSVGTFAPNRSNAFELTAAKSDGSKSSKASVSFEMDANYNITAFVSPATDSDAADYGYVLQIPITAYADSLSSYNQPSSYPYNVYWRITTTGYGAPVHYSKATPLAAAILSSWVFYYGLGYTNTLLQYNYLAYNPSSPLTSSEKAYSAAAASSSGWKPMFCYDGTTMILVACSNAAVPGQYDAENATLIYYAGRYYKVVNAAGSDTSEAIGYGYGIFANAAFRVAWLTLGTPDYYGNYWVRVS